MRGLTGLRLRSLAARLRRDPMVRRLAGATTWSVVGAAAGRGLTVIASLAVARLFGPALFGQLGLIQATVVVVGAFAGFGAELTATLHIAQKREADPDSAARHAGLALVSAAAVGSALAAAVLLLAVPIAGSVLGSEGLAPALRLAVAVLVFGAIGSAQLGVLGGLERFSLVCLANLVRGVLVSSLLLVGAATAGVEGAVAGLSLGELLTAVVTQALVRRAVHQAGLRIRYAGIWVERQALWRVSLPALASALVVQPALWFGQILLVHGGGYEQAGFFTLSYRWYLLVVFLCGTIAPVSLPLLSSLRTIGPPAAYLRVVRLTMLTTVIVVAVPGALIALLAPLLVRLSGPGFGASTPALAILAVSAIPTATNTVLSQIALSLGHVRAWLVSDLLYAGALAVLAITLIPPLGAAGLAVGFFVALLVSSAALVLPVWRSLSTISSRAAAP